VLLYRATGTSTYHWYGGRTVSDHEQVLFLVRRFREFVEASFDDHVTGTYRVWPSLAAIAIPPWLSAAPARISAAT